MDDSGVTMTAEVLATTFRSIKIASASGGAKKKKGRK